MNYKKSMLILCQMVFSGQNFAINAILLIFLTTADFALYSNLLHLCGIISSFFATLIINYQFNQNATPDKSSWIVIHRLTIIISPILAIIIIILSDSVSSVGIVAYGFVLLIILRDLYCRIQQMSDYFVSTIVMVVLQLGILASFLSYSGVNSGVILILSLLPFMLGATTMSVKRGVGDSRIVLDTNLLFENGKISGFNAFRNLILISLLPIFLGDLDFEIFYITRLIFSPLLFMVPILSVFILKYADTEDLDIYLKLSTKSVAVLTVTALLIVFFVSQSQIRYLYFSEIQWTTIPLSLVIYWLLYFSILVYRALLETFLIKGGDTNIRSVNSYMGVVATFSSLLIYWALDGSRLLPYYWIIVMVELLLVIMIFTKMHRKGI